MTTDFEFFKTAMPSSREADYYLGCLDSSVFIDFKRSDNDQIELIRISFDGYGCCNLDGKAVRLNHEDSEEFVEEMEKENFDQQVLTRIVKKAIELNRENLWKDAIEEYGLI